MDQLLQAMERGDASAHVTAQKRSLPYTHTGVPPQTQHLSSSTAQLPVAPEGLQGTLLCDTCALVQVSIGWACPSPCTTRDQYPWKGFPFSKAGNTQRVVLLSNADTSLPETHQPSPHKGAGLLGQRALSDPSACTSQCSLHSCQLSVLSDV